MLDEQVITELNEHINNIIKNLPARKEEFAAELEEAAQDDPTGISEYNAHMKIIDAVVREIRGEARNIVVRISKSEDMDEKEIGQIIKIVNQRTPEIGRVVNSLKF